MAKPLFGLAKKLFDMQHRGAKVPANVLAAARNVLKKTDTESDRQLIYKSVGATKTGAKQYKSALKSINAPLDLAAKYATLGNLVNQGGGMAVIGGMKFASEAAGDVNKLAHSKWFKDAMSSVLGDALKGEAAANGLGAAARYAGMAIGTVAQAATYVGGSIVAGEALGGLGNFDERRLSFSEHALARANPRLNWREKALAEMKFRRAENRASGFNALPLIGGIGASNSDQETGGEMGELETRIALSKNHLGAGVNVESLRALGKDRYYDKAFLGSPTLGRFARSITRAGSAGDNAAEAGATEEANKALSRATALKNAGFKFAEEGNFDAARESLRQAEKEVPGSAPAWQNPEALYPAMLQGAAGRRMWAFSNMPRRTRTGE